MPFDATGFEKPEHPTAKVLRDAADIIQRDGVCFGTGRRNGGGVCLAQAVAEASEPYRDSIDLPPWKDGPLNWHWVFNLPAGQALGKFLGVPPENIWNWHDRHKFLFFAKYRAKKKAIDALNGAADMVEREQVDA